MNMRTFPAALLLLRIALSAGAALAQTAVTQTVPPNPASNVAGVPGGAAPSASTAAIVTYARPDSVQPTGGGTLAYSSATSASVATTSGQLFAAAAYKRIVQICTLPNSTSNVWLNLAGGAAAVNAGTPVYAGGGCTTIGTSSLPMPTAAVNAINDGGSSQTVTITGG